MYNGTIETVICFSLVIILNISKQLYNSIIKCYTVEVK